MGNDNRAQDVERAVDELIVQAECSGARAARSRSPSRYLVDDARANLLALFATERAEREREAGRAEALAQRVAELEREREWPRWRHDCDECIYLGPHEDDYGRADLYVHATGPLPTVIARRGNEPHDYESGLGAAADAMPALGEARRRAVEAGHLPPAPEAE